ncbi:MAG: transcriptional repressor [Prosthecochloris sp.]|uniref:Fur family transcriptional regulator n=1 Tax=Prosthecochloris sp. TaxID=290513 RepID=UPI00258454FD|nr:transcriptional repressor [Prosthecochloris sp.]MCW8797727.1 transcriptional repressor [Prosthecochloris sp.]
MNQERSGKPYRNSRQRTRLLEILRSTDSHPTAAWLYDQLKPEFPALSLGTVYRNLTTLIDQGLAKKIDSGSTFDRFEAKTTPHYHLICRTCGSITDFEKPLFTDLNEVVSSSTDFVIESHRIDFYGICPLCRKENRTHS